ncbi:MAG TPA: IS66 family transposase [Candidatus Aminicenantes bacterium]|nr:IS66 family transposase [Candidatus Aminicenantes bacterium]
MSFDVLSTSKTDSLHSAPVSNILNKVVENHIVHSRSSDHSCKNCTFIKEYYIALCERGYWKAQHSKAIEREEELKKKIKELEAKLRMREKQLFGKKSEKSNKIEGQANADKIGKKNRGQQPGKPGHGRGKHDRLEVIEEVIEIPEEERYCAICGLPFEDFPGTEDSEDIVVNVKAYKRRRKRKRYKKACKCPETPGIITAPLPPKLIPKGILDTSVWVKIILDKYYLYRPTYRFLRELDLYDVDIAQGTVTGGLKKIAPLFDPILKEIEEKNKSAAHWHGDETRWQVFELIEGKLTYRWYLWVFVTKDTVFFILDPTRSAKVPKEHFAKVIKGILSVDRYVAYKVLLKDGRIILAFCWAHQRRDFINLANSYPELEEWAFEWVELIRNLYHLNDIRVSYLGDPEAFKESDEKLREAILDMEERIKEELSQKKKDAECEAILKSMKNHWEGLTVFVDYPEVPMDNNLAERMFRGPVVGRKNFYGSGAVWSGYFAAAMFSIFQTLELSKLNQYLWLTEYLEACAGNGAKPPDNISRFLPWKMSKERLRYFSKKPEIKDSS